MFADGVLAPFQSKKFILLAQEIDKNTYRFDQVLVLFDFQ